MSLRTLVVCTPGLETLTATEMRGLGVGPGKAVFGGVPCDVSQQQLYGLNLRMRTATRVLLRVGNGFVDGPISLRRLIDEIEWERYVGGCQLLVSASTKASTMFHTDMINEQVWAAIASRATVSSDPTAPSQRVLVRIDHDRATVSLDSSGERLDRRGCRLDGAKAPMRETLAAALVLTSGWSGAGPLVDPFCGSGTIVIEAALWARRLAPGRLRRFAFQQWPSFTRKAWRGAQDQATAGERLTEPVMIVAGDRDAGAVAAARANAERAGVGDLVEVRHGAVSNLRWPSGTGAVVTNPPYGRRVGEADKLRDLYDSFGRLLAKNASGWSLTMVDADRTLSTRAGVRFEERVSTDNGGIDVTFVHGRV